MIYTNLSKMQTNSFFGLTGLLNPVIFLKKKFKNPSFHPKIAQTKGQEVRTLIFLAFILTLSNQLSGSRRSSVVTVLSIIPVAPAPVPVNLPMGCSRNYNHSTGRWRSITITISITVIITIVIPRTPGMINAGRKTDGNDQHTCNCGNYS